MLAVNPMISKQRASFDERTNQAYTHGLEQIYALETIDPSTVKKIELPKSIEEDNVVTENLHCHDLWNGQYQLELGDEYRGWMPPLFLKEPVQVLELSQRAEIVCQDRGIDRLIDLIGVDFNNWINEKGVGQGHIDEIQQKLRQYIDGRSLERSYYIEWKSLIRSLAVGMERKKMFALLQSFDLESVQPLTPIERMETLNLQEQTKNIWQEEASQELRNSKRAALVKETLYQITRVFLSPWIRARGGLVNLSEVAERTERISEEPEIVSKAIMFLEHVYGFKNHPFADCLVEAELGLYCPDHYTAKAFQIICQRAESYFYSQKIVYKFKELTSLLAQEFGTVWEGFPEILGEMSLKRSRRFRVRKGECGELVVYCNASCRSTQASHAPQA